MFKMTDDIKVIVLEIVFFKYLHQLAITAHLEMTAVNIVKAVVTTTATI